MDIKVVSSTFPPDVQKVILELLKYVQDPIEIRNSLTKYFNDVWIIIKGLSFSYSVSKSNKSAGLYQNLKSKFFYLIYNPPFVEISSQNPQSSCESSEWTVFKLKQSEKTEEMTENIMKVLKKQSYDDTSSACQSIKYHLNEIEKNFWHVLVGKEFTCALPKDGVEFMVYAKAQKKKEMLDVVVFRKQGCSKKIKVFGLLKGIAVAFLTLIFFLGVFGFIKCGSEDKTWLCSNYSAFLYIGITFIFAKSYTMLLSKFR